jgi:putative chitinase
VLITLQRLIDFGIPVVTARAFEPPLNDACERFQIDTPKRVAMFLAQAAHESVNFTVLEERLSYSDPFRIVDIFRRGFDLDRDGVVDPAEVEFARGYVRKPRELANRAYANRGGNGDEASGDGWKYRGRGIFQLTFKDNYMAAANALGVPYDYEPELVTLPLHAALAAAWFAAKVNLNEAADLGDDKLAARRVNGPAMLGLPHRIALRQNAAEVFA